MMTRVMAGLFAVMFAAFAVASLYLAGDLTGRGISGLFAVS